MHAPVGSALGVQDLVDVHYPDADCIRVVLDNLNTHTPASLYKIFPPEEARRICRRIEFHYTPKHASWLNMVEIEICVFSRQCLDRRIADIDKLRLETQAWVNERNKTKAHINWMFDVKAARKKLAKSYPNLETKN